MPIVYHCPHCRQPVTVPDAVLGQAIGCPHCRGAFQTFPAQAPTPVPSAQQPLSLDDEPADTGNGFDQLDSPRRGRNGSASRYRAQKKGTPLPNITATIAAVIGSALVMVYNQANRRPGQGFDIKEVLISAVVGGISAGIGFGIGKLIEGNTNTYSKRSRRDED
ncbi:hypothetical protein J8F10_27765 [Gemmata sp. G18]|uniref:Zinc ribbon domain-containing protein n=1 Tax=Gemmata palustris TaxID=2822762 RepID=A0ABS5BZE2_9BACT|nr:hypothetical protein [Gemmata palustris]MBP3959059.1 hypothetical protein [Gemmata palustris]